MLTNHPSYGMLNLINTIYNKPIFVGIESKSSHMVCQISLNQSEYCYPHYHPTQKLFSLNMHPSQLALLVSSINTDTYIPCALLFYVDVNGNKIETQEDQSSKKSKISMYKQISEYFKKIAQIDSSFFQELGNMNIDVKLKNKIFNNIKDNINLLKSNSVYVECELYEIFEKICFDIMMEVNNFAKLNSYNIKDVNIEDQLDINRNNKFGVIKVNNIKNDKINIYGVSYTPINIVNLQIYEAVEIIKDNISKFIPIPNKAPLYDIFMTFEQWSSFLFNPNVGYGSCCTISAIEGNNIENCPIQQNPIIEHLDKSRTLKLINEYSYENTNQELLKLIRSRKINSTEKNILSTINKNYESLLNQYSQFFNAIVLEFAKELSYLSQDKIRKFAEEYSLSLMMNGSKLELEENKKDI